jgi:hypothetical protein
MALMNVIPVDSEVHVGWRYHAIDQSATRDGDTEAKAEKLQPLRGGYEVQDEDELLA